MNSLAGQACPTGVRACSIAACHGSTSPTTPTSSAESRRRLFLDSALAQGIVDLCASLRDQRRIDLYGYVVMPDHYHVLLGLRGSDTISQVLRGVHSLVVKECRRRGHCSRRTMQRRSYDHVVRDEKDWLSRLQYIHNNPVTAGLVEDAIDYPWSSCASG